MKENEDLRLIDSYEAACDYIGDPHEILTELSKHEAAYIQLKAIAKALNYGKSLSDKERECYYYPVFRVFNSDEIKAMGEEALNPNNDLVFCGVTKPGNNCSNFTVADDNFFFPGLGVYDSDTANYFGEKFVGLWTDFYSCSEK